MRTIPLPTTISRLSLWLLTVVTPLLTNPSMFVRSSFSRIAMIACAPVVLGHSGPAESCPFPQRGCGCPSRIDPRGVCVTSIRHHLLLVQLGTFATDVFRDTEAELEVVSSASPASRDTCARRILYIWFTFLIINVQLTYKR